MTLQRVIDLVEAARDNGFESSIGHRELIDFLQGLAESKPADIKASSVFGTVEQALGCVATDLCMLKSGEWQVHTDEGKEAINDTYEALIDSMIALGCDRSKIAVLGESEYREDCCQDCGEELECDKFSQYYCPNHGCQPVLTLRRAKHEDIQIGAVMFWEDPDNDLCSKKFTVADWCFLIGSSDVFITDTEGNEVNAQIEELQVEDKSE